MPAKRRAMSTHPGRRGVRPSWRSTPAREPTGQPPSRTPRSRTAASTLPAASVDGRQRVLVEPITCRETRRPRWNVGQQTVAADSPRPAVADGRQLSGGATSLPPSWRRSSSSASSRTWVCRSWAAGARAWAHSAASRPSTPNPAPFKRPSARGRRDRLHPWVSGRGESNRSIVRVDPHATPLTDRCARVRRHATGPCRPQRSRSGRRLQRLAAQRTRETCV